MTFLTRSAVAFLALVTLSAAGPGPSTLLGAGPAIPSKPDDKTILHVLNRIGFGARPGDVERVRQIGLAAYIDQQLSPERVPDELMTKRLAGFETLDLSSRAIAQGYYVPAQMARRQAQLAGKD